MIAGHPASLRCAVGETGATIGHVSQRRRTAILATALGLALTLEVIRVWMASVVFVYGQAGQIPAYEMGAFAVLPFLVVLSGAPALTRLLGAHRTVLVGGSILVGSRLGLQATDGGDAQLALATFAVLGGMLWLAAAGASVPSSGRSFGLGIVLGFALDAMLRAITGHQGLVWLDGHATWVALAVLVLSFLGLSWRARAGAGEPSSLAVSAWPLIVIGPALALHAMVAPGNRLAATADLDPAVATPVVLLAHVLAVAAAVALRQARPPRVGGGLLLLGLAATVAARMPFEVPPVIAGGQVLLIIGLGVCVAAAGRSSGASTPARRALSTALGMLIFFVVTFGYYTSYDIPVAIPAGAFLVLAAGVVAVVAFTARPRAETALHPRRGFIASVAVAALLAGAPALLVERPGVHAEGGLPIRVATYNVHMGYDTTGRYDPSGLADVITGMGADVVGLQEVDRGWLITGGTDVLADIGARVGMPYVFAGAADPVWGNAVLSRHPIVEVRTEPLPGEATAMSRSALVAILDVGGREIAFVVSHLHHVEADASAREAQAVRLAAIAGGLQAEGLPVVLVGDLNAQPEDRELRPLRGVLVNASASLGPRPTWPSWDPQVTIDHILISTDLTASRLEVPDVTASDHLPVVLDVARQD